VKFGLVGMFCMFLLAVLIGVWTGSCVTASRTDKTVVAATEATAVKATPVNVTEPAPKKDKVTQALEKNPSLLDDKTTVPKVKKEPVVTVPAIPLPEKPVKAVEPAQPDTKLKEIAENPPVIVRADKITVTGVKGGPVEIRPNKPKQLVTAKQIYWVTRLDYARGACIGLLIASAILAVVTVIILLAAICQDETVNGAYKKLTAVVWLVLTLSIAGVIFTPSTGEAATMYIAPRIVNSEFVSQTVPEDLRQLYDLFKGYVKEKLQPEGKK
jgi:hypothetical protein